MSDAAKQTARQGLDTDPLGFVNSLPRHLPAVRSANWSQTGGNGWGYRGTVRSAYGNRRLKGYSQMSYRRRFAIELGNVYKELLNTPPIILLLLCCLAVLLVGAILVGATR